MATLMYLKRRIFILVFYLSYLSKVSCLEIKKDHHESAWDKKENWRKIIFGRRNFFDWNPSDFKRNSLQPRDEPGTSRNPFDWNCLDLRRNILETDDDKKSWRKKNFLYDPFDCKRCDIKKTPFQAEADIGNRKKIYSTRDTFDYNSWNLKKYTLSPTDNNNRKNLLTTKDPLDWNSWDRNRKDFKGNIFSSRRRPYRPVKKYKGGGGGSKTTYSALSVIGLCLGLSCCFACCVHCCCTALDQHQSVWDHYNDWRKNAFTSRDPFHWNHLDLKRNAFQPRDNLHDWWKKIFLKREPFHRNRSQLKKVILQRRDNICTWWKKILTRHPNDWNRWDFKKRTLPPRDNGNGWRENLFVSRDHLDWTRWDRSQWNDKRIIFSSRKHLNHSFRKYRGGSSKGIATSIGLIILCLCLSCSFSCCVYFCCKTLGRISQNDLDSSDGSGQSSSTRNSTLSTVSRTLASDRPHLVIEFTNETDSSNRSALDRPPQYDDVVLSDFGLGNMSTSVPDTSPPKYNDGTSSHEIPPNLS